MVRLLGRSLSLNRLLWLLITRESSFLLITEPAHLIRGAEDLQEVHPETMRRSRRVPIALLLVRTGRSRNAIKSAFLPPSGQTASNSFTSIFICVNQTQTSVLIFTKINSGGKTVQHCFRCHKLMNSYSLYQRSSLSCSISSILEMNF